MLQTRASLAAPRIRFWSNARGVRNVVPRRGLITLGIETSCDDTAVAIVSTRGRGNSCKIPFDKKITPNLTAYRGIHPGRALDSHIKNLGNLVDDAINRLPLTGPMQKNAPRLRFQTYPDIHNHGSKAPFRQKPGLIAVSRGPGMVSNLTAGLELAKGLSLAWQVPIIGVHHMQAHLLTPRLLSSVANFDVSRDAPVKPEFPFVSVLVSGGHTMIVKSDSVVKHSVLATSQDIAVGDALDKAAREILPDSILESAKTTMYAWLMESFAFPNGSTDYSDYKAPMTRGEEIERAKTVFPQGWSFTTPYAQTRELALSFAYTSAISGKIAERKQELAAAGQTMSDDERRNLARVIMTSCFEHIASRTIITLESMCEKTRDQAARPLPETLPINTLVLSGGVACNKYFAHIMRGFLDSRGFGSLQINVPPPRFCTDNAMMVAWAGMEMWRVGYSSERSIAALGKWSLEKVEKEKVEGEAQGNRGLLGVDGWIYTPKPFT